MTDNRKFFIENYDDIYCLSRLVNNNRRYCPGYAIYFQEHKISVVNVDNNMRNQILLINEHFPSDILETQLASDYIIIISLNTFLNIKTIDNFIKNILITRFPDDILQEVTQAQFYDKCLEEKNLFQLTL
jgi:hypothetical protein